MQAELSKVYSHNSVKAYPSSIIEIFKVEAIEEDLRERTLLMLDKLKHFGLPEIYRFVLVYKFVYNWTDGEIADELAIPSRKTVYSIRRKALELLRERNFKY